MPKQWITTSSPLEYIQLNKERLQRVIDRALSVTEQQLSASEVKVFQHEGRVLYSKALVNHKARGSAAERVFRHFLPRVKEEAKAPVIVVPEWAYGEEPGGEGTSPIETAPLPSPPSFSIGPNGEVDLAEWGHIVPFPTEQTLGVGAKIATPCSGVHEPSENLGHFETPRPPQATRTVDAPQPPGPSPIAQPQPNMAKPDPSLDVAESRSSNASLYGAEASEGFSWLDEVRR